MAASLVTLRVTRRYGPGPLEAMQRDLDGNSAAAAYRCATNIRTGARRRVHVITGYLRSTIQQERLAYGHHRVWVGAEYGVYEEYGTRHRPPHPYFRPAVSDAKRQFISDMRRVFKAFEVLEVEA